jgi:large subunit ribosomal protein L16
MNLRPKKTKYTRYQKGRITKGYNIRAYNITFGNFAIQALEKGKITEQQIEAVRRTVTQKTQRQVKI